MSWSKVGLVAALLCIFAVAQSAELKPFPAALSPIHHSVSESAAKDAVCMYRAKLAYDAANFRIRGGKRELYQVRMSDHVDPELKARTLAAVDLAFENNGTAEEVAAFVYGDCIGTRI
jgi:hypothetical protein